MPEEAICIIAGSLLFFCLVIIPIWMLLLLRGLRARHQDQDARHTALANRLLREIQLLRDGMQPTAPREPPVVATPAAAAPAREISARPPLTATVAAPVPVRAPLPPRPEPIPPPPVPLPAAAPSAATPPAVATSQPEAVDSAAVRILRATWNWLIVGAEHRRPGVSVEEAVATNWLIRIGVLVLVVGIGFFLKYSIDKGILGPQARVAMSFLTGAFLLVGGLRLFGRQYQLLGQGLAGAGVATLYFAVFAAAGLFRLVPMPAGFALMALVTCTACVLAVRYQTVLLAVLGTLGGYLTPIMLTLPSGSDVWFLGYLLVLALGVTGVAWHRRWPTLTYMSFVCHNLIFFHAADWNAFGTTLPFFAAYFVVYTTAVMLPALTHGKSITALEPIGLLLTAAVFFYGGYELVRGTFSRAAVAWVTIGMAAYYTAHVFFFLRRAVQHRAFLATFLGLAGGSLALTLPLLLSKAWLTMAWSILALVAMWVAIKVRSPLLRGLSLALHVFVAFKLAVLDFPDAYGGALPATLRAYWPVLLAHATQFGVPTASFWLSSRLLTRLPPEPERRTPAHGGFWGIVCLIAMYVLLFLVLNIDLACLCTRIWAPCQVTVLTLIWVGFGLHLLARRDRLGTRLCAWLAGLVLLALAGKFLFDFDDWQPEWELLVYGDRAQRGGTGLRLVDVGMMVAYLTLAWQVWRRQSGMRAWAWASGYVALAMLFLHLTFEVATVVDQFLPGFRGGAVSVFWALFAFALIIGGIRYQVRPLRYLGLGLFAAVVAKIFLVDLDHLASMYRIAAFVVLGIVMLLAGFVYLKQARSAGNPNRDHEVSP